MRRLAIRLMQRLRLRDERGEVYVEYTVLASLAVLVILGAIQYFFGGISFLFQRMGDTLRGISG
jgi:Flp pilus assembly pilin Flp